MNRDELLDKLAMELEEWPKTTRDAPSGINALWCFEKGSCPEDSGVYAWATHNPGPDDDTINEYDWLARRAELINKPSWDDAPEWAQWRAQDSDGEWWWFGQKPIKGEAWWGSSDGRLDSAQYGSLPAGHNWHDTLEPRPQAKPKTCRHCDITFNRPHLDSIPGDRCTRCDDEIKALWPEPEPVKTRWTSKKCTQCGHTTAAKVSDDNPVCPGCVALSEPGRELNLHTSSLHYDEDDRGVCTDGSPCGKPANPSDDAYCLGCPNYAEDSDEESALSQAMEEQMRAAAEKWARGDMEARSKYHREVKPGVWIDVYDVLQAWGVKNPALQHLIKKALAPGQRGHKDLMTDMDDIVASAKRARELES